MQLANWLAGYLVIGSAIGHLAVESSYPAIGTDVSGVVRDARGRPMGDVKVSLMRVDDVPPAKVGGKAGKTLVELDSLRTAATGAFRFPSVSNGRYQLLLARGMNWMIAEGLVIDGTPRGPIVLVMNGKTRLITLPVKRLPSA